MEPKKSVQQVEMDIKPAQIVPIRTYRAKGFDEFVATLEAEAKVGRGRALVRVSITPDLAATIIERCNVGNRPMRMPNLRRYVAAMSEGRWGDSTIMFGAGDAAGDGQLRIGDAQHRLHAVKDSGTEQFFDVRVYTVPEDFEAAVRRCDERGTARTLRDLLVIEGLSEAGAGQRIEGAVNTMVMFDGTKPKKMPLSNEERLDYAQRKIRSLLWVVRDLPRGAFKPHIAGALAFCHVKDAKAANELAQAVAAGESLTKGTPAHTLLQIKEGLNAAKGDVLKRRAMAAVIRLFDDHRAGKKSPTRVEVFCDTTKASVERVVGKRAWGLLEESRKR